MIKTEIFNGEAINNTLIRISKEIISKNDKIENLAIIGLQTRGVYLAQRIAKKIEEIKKISIPVGLIDITLYRDDININNDISFHTLKKSEIPFSVNGKNIILVDDVLFTGRSVRAAIDAIIDFGRPKKIQLAILIDRGHRELPIRPDYVGQNLPTAMNEPVRVMLTEEDGIDRVIVEKGEPS